MTDANAVYLAYVDKFGIAPGQVTQLIAFGRDQKTSINYKQARDVLKDPPSGSGGASSQPKKETPSVAKSKSPPTAQKKSPSPPKPKLDDQVSNEKSLKPTVAKRHSKPNVSKPKSATPVPTATSPTPKKKAAAHRKTSSVDTPKSKSQSTKDKQAAARNAALSVSQKKRASKSPDSRGKKKDGSDRLRKTGGKKKNGSDRLASAGKNSKRNSKTPASLSSAAKTKKEVFTKKKQIRYVPNPAGELMKTHIRKSTLAISRKKQKAEVNLPWGDFKIKINHRYRMDDGRIGVCRFNNRTLFGKSTHNWVGLVIEHGAGENNGTVFGKQYFRCGEGKGIMVRPIRLIEHLGGGDKKLTKAMKNGGKEILKEVKAERAAEKAAGLADKPDKKAPKSSMDWVPPKWDDFEEDHGTGMLDQKLRYNKRLLDKNKGKSVAKKKRVDEIGTNNKYQGTEFKQEEDDFLAPRPENAKLKSKKKNKS